VAIESYNRDDCESLADLRDWLWSLAGEVAEARSATEDDADPVLVEIATMPDLRERLVAASKVATGGPLVRQTFVAMDFSGEFDADQLGPLLGVRRPSARIPHPRQEGVWVAAVGGGVAKVRVSRCVYMFAEGGCRSLE